MLDIDVFVRSETGELKLTSVLCGPNAILGHVSLDSHWWCDRHIMTHTELGTL